ncbi:MAG: hypothetical protein LKK19_01865 [Bacteroidales bacterium]|jgi:hypothetical protein|nr:hypothetical protein [Bacteroidales bacterium]MCI2145857.1 hypothetical protein [Bacteroidales bacterium]
MNWLTILLTFLNLSAVTALIVALVTLKSTKKEAAGKAADAVARAKLTDAQADSQIGHNWQELFTAVNQQRINDKQESDSKIAELSKSSDTKIGKLNQEVSTLKGRVTELENNENEEYRAAMGCKHVDNPETDCPVVQIKRQKARLKEATA